MSIIEEVCKPIYTEVDELRCKHLLEVMQSIRDEKIPGDLIETGVYKGGTSIIMAWANREYKLNKMQFCFDSFQGCPDPAETKLGAHKDEAHGKGDFSFSIEDVIKNFEKFDLQDDPVFIEGWFEDTCPKYAETIEAIALLRFDGDLYSSTLEVLEAFYPKVVKGGYVIIDDYCLEACRVAVHEYLDKYKIEVEIRPPTGSNDGCGSWWRKP
jgi:hypothetical protein